MDLSVTCLQVDSLFSHIIPRKTDGEKKQTGWWFQRIWKNMSQIGSFPPK